MKKPLQIILILMLVSGCVASQQGNYTPPEINSEAIENSILINKSYDQVWSTLINYASNEFYGIDNFEKDSGLITLSFSSKTPEQFITGGNMEVTSSQTIVYNGDYAGWLNQCCNPSLTGRINLTVSKEGENLTKLTVNARYVLSGVFSTPASNIGSMEPENQTWTFNTNGSDSQKIYSGIRTFKPTHNLEKRILASFLD